MDTDIFKMPSIGREKLAVGIGEALWDMLPGGKELGGAPANFAFHVSQFGIPSCVVSAVGPDEAGIELRKAVEEKALSNILIEVPFPTGSVEISVDEVGVPSYDIVEKVAWDNIPFHPELQKLAEQTCALCFGSLAQRNPVSRATISSFIDAIPTSNEALIICDVNLRQSYFSKEVIISSLQRCNTLKINDEELPVVASLLKEEGADARDTCRRILNLFALKYLILTCGVDGSYVFSREEESYLPTPKVDVVDTVGAGDSFTAAFVASILMGRGMKEAHEKAVETSAFVCTCNGAMPRLPEEITKFIS